MAKGILGDMQISNKELQEALKANADGSIQYIGLNDDMLNFGDAESFVDEGDAEREFTIKLSNSTAAAQKIQFNDFIAGTLENHTLLAEGDVVTVDSSHKLTCEGDPRSFDVLKALIKETPLRVREIRFNVSDAAQLDEPIKYHVETPFMTGSTKQLVPSNYQDQNTQNTKTTVVPFKNCILGYDSTLSYVIRSGVTVTMVLRFGASLDLANALRKKYAAAVATAARFYAMKNAAK
jgi:hypothetical protein